MFSIDKARLLSILEFLISREKSVRLILLSKYNTYGEILYARNKLAIDFFRRSKICSNFREFIKLAKVSRSI